MSESYKMQQRKRERERTSSDIIAGNGRVVKVYIFIVWLTGLNNYKMLIIFSLRLMYFRCIMCK